MASIPLVRIFDKTGKSMIYLNYKLVTAIIKNEPENAETDALHLEKHGGVDIYLADGKTFTLDNTLDEVLKKFGVPLKSNMKGGPLRIMRQDERIKE